MDSLCHDKLYFANPNSFNDPMDCRPSVVSDSEVSILKIILRKLIEDRVTAETMASLNQMKLAFPEAIKHSAKLSKSSANEVLSEIEYHATDSLENSGKRENFLLTRRIEVELLKQYNKGVCCFTAEDEPLNSLLWSHYGDQHKGLCIGYSLDRTPKPTLHKVDYTDSRTLNTSLIANALLNNITKAKEQLDHAVLLKKAKLWEYESEWRLFDTIGLNDSPLKMTDITFGLRCSPAVVHTVVSALDNRNDNIIRFYQVKQKPESYLLKREEIDPEISIYFPHIAQSSKEIWKELDE